MSESDRAWERARRYFMLQKWETRLAYVGMVGAAIAAAWHLASGNIVKAVVGVIFAAALLWIARWLPPLINFDDGSDEQ